MVKKSDKSLSYNANTQTLVGVSKKTFIDCDTGEQIYLDNIVKRQYGTKNFWKMYLMDFLTVLGIMESKQLDVFIYIAENTNQANNLFIGSYRKIANDVGVCYRTVTTIMKKLQDNNFIKKVQNGVWLVNPNIMMKGNDHKRQILLTYYQSDEPINEITFTRTQQKQLHIDNEDTALKLKQSKKIDDLLETTNNEEE
uniref:Plasmid replication protein RepL domain-containing protein n=1 Tax=uncultured prokaryote TaxID=198431 RepID=A0A0H5Q6L3_9ZZZZ|nr:hypothetical protein [uncultured prokaryote]